MLLDSRRDPCHEVRRKTDSSPAATSAETTSRAVSPLIEGDHGQKVVGHLACVAENHAVLFLKCNQDDRTRNREEQPFGDGEAEAAAPINAAALPHGLQPQRSQLP